MAQYTEYFGFYGISQLRCDVAPTLRMGARIPGLKQNAHCNVGNNDECSLLFGKKGVFTQSRFHFDGKVYFFTLSPTSINFCKLFILVDLKATKLNVILWFQSFVSSTYISCLSDHG